jgi:hypothetical protein
LKKIRKGNFGARAIRLQACLPVGRKTKFNFPDFRERFLQEKPDTSILFLGARLTACFVLAKNIPQSTASTPETLRVCGAGGPRIFFENETAA